MARPGTVGRWLAAVGALGLAALLATAAIAHHGAGAGPAPIVVAGGAAAADADGRGFHEVDPTRVQTVGDRAPGSAADDPAPDGGRRARPSGGHGARHRLAGAHPPDVPTTPALPGSPLPTVPIAPDGDHATPDPRRSARPIRSTPSSTPAHDGLPTDDRSRRSASPCRRRRRPSSPGPERWPAPVVGSASGRGWSPRSSCCSSRPSWCRSWCCTRWAPPASTTRPTATSSSPSTTSGPGSTPCPSPSGTPGGPPLADRLRRLPRRPTGSRRRGLPDVRRRPPLRRVERGAHGAGRARPRPAAGARRPRPPSGRSATPEPATMRWLAVPVLAGDRRRRRARGDRVPRAGSRTPSPARSRP